MSDQASPVLVVGHRSGPVGLAALRHASWLATGLRAHLQVVHVSALEDYPPDSDGLDWETEAERDHSAEESAVAAELAGHAGPWSYELEHGVPSDVLCRIAIERDAAMVVIGSDTAAGGLVRHALGRSTVRGLLRHAVCPVVIVPGPQR